MEIKKYPFVTSRKEPGNDIIFVEYRKKLKIDLPIAKELVANRMDFTGGQPYYFIFDVSNILYFTSEAKEYMQSPDEGAKDILGGAFIAGNPVAALLAAIFIRKVKSVPTKFFWKVNDALLWLEELKQKNHRK